jgi:SH3-like domain-containing protein
MRSFLIFSIAIMLNANPLTLLDKESGFYKNNTNKMLALYESKNTQNIINQIPIDAICIIALERHKNGKALVEYKGQQGWVDVSKNPNNIVLMSHEEMQIPMTSLCSQVGSYFFEVKSIQKAKPVKVYEKPSTKSKVTTTLPDQKSCLINLGCQWPWCHVDYGNGSGWVLSTNLSDRIQNVDGYCLPRERKTK